MIHPVPDFDDAEHRYSHDGRVASSVTQVLTGLGLTPPYPSDRGQQSRGTAVHKAAELAIWDRLDYAKTSPAIIPYINGLMEKAEEMKIRPIFTEIRGIHTAEWFAGTIDLFCTVYDSDLAVIDYKTGNPPRCTELQTAGYGELMLFIESMQKQPRFTRANMPRRFSLQLTPNRAICRECKDPYDYPAFIGAVRLFKWMKEKRKDQ
jgi:hypothetical protein